MTHLQNTKPQSGLKDFVIKMMVRPVLRHKRPLVLGLFALLILSMAQTGMLFLVKGFLTAFFADPSVATVSLESLLPSKFHSYLGGWRGVIFSKTQLAWGVPLAIVGAGMLNALASYWYNFSQEEIALRVASHYRETMFSSILKLPYLASMKRNAGEWMSVIMSDSQFLQSRLADLLTGFVKDGVLIFACLLGLTIIHWPSAVVLALIAPWIAWSMGRAGKRISFFAEAFQRELGNLAAALLDIRSRFRYMKSQNAERFEKQVFEEANQRYLDMMTSSIFIRALVTPLMEWVGFAIFASFLLAWNKGVMGTAFTPEIGVQFFVALGLLLRPIRQMGEQVARWGETQGALRRSMMVFQEIDAAAQSQGSLGVTSVATQPIRMQPLIAIDHVVCKYGNRVTFEAKDLTLASGRAVAIIGASGAGKSTFIKCMSGLIPPAAWQASLGWADAVAHTSFVSQSPFLFSDTLRRNLLYGLSGDVLEQTTDEMLYGALSVVKLDAFVKTLPHGLETIYNPVAHNFSGGQIQRFVIARALLRRRPILLLDEATSAIDGATERDVTKTFVDTVHQTGTILLSVTHRLTWLSLYDEVWFIKDGQIALKGKHEDLLRNESYQRYVRAEAESEPTSVMDSQEVLFS